MPQQTFNVSAPDYLNDDTDVMGPLSPWLNQYNQVFPGDPNMPDAMSKPPAPWLSSAPGPASPPITAPSAQEPVTPPKMLNSPPFPPNPGYESAMGKLESIEADRPQLSKPKWWERALAGAAGGLAGWSNAASRTKNPIDIGAMQENILHPGYSQSLSEWQSRVIPAQAQADIEGQKQQAWWKNQELQARLQRDKAYEDYMEGLGRGGSVDVTPEMEQLTGGVFKAGSRIPQSTATELARIEAGKYVKPEKTFTVTDPDMAKQLKVPVGTAVPQSFYLQALKPSPNENEWSLYLNANNGDAGKALAQWRADKVAMSRQSRDPLADELRQARLDEMQSQASDRVESTKKAQEQVILKDRQAEVDNLLKAGNFNTEDDLWADPASAAKLKAINRKYAPRLQDVQDQYARSIRNRGGSAPGYRVDPDTLATTSLASTTPVPAGAPPKTAAAAAPTATSGPPKRVTVKLPDGRFMTGTEDQFRQAGVQLAQR